jgi:phosphohistidine swiveling domain-containing protein
MLREIGRGFGSGTLSLATAGPDSTDKPSASVRLVAKDTDLDTEKNIDRAVERNAAVRAKRGTAFLRGKSFDPSTPWSIEKVNKY